MKLRPLLLSVEVHDAIREKREFAEQNPMNLHDLYRTRHDPKKAVGNDRRFVLIIPMGYRCVFSVEKQPEPLGLVRHLSVSVIDEDLACMPSPDGVVILAQLYGMPGGLRSMLKVWTEPLTCGGAAVNLIQKLI